MKFRIDPDEISFGEQMDIQDGNLRAFHDMLIRFAVDDDGNPIAPEDASKEVRSWKRAEIQQRAVEIAKQLTDGALPPKNASV